MSAGAYGLWPWLAVAVLVALVALGLWAARYGYQAPGWTP